MNEYLDLSLLHILMKTLCIVTQFGVNSLRLIVMEYLLEMRPNAR
ncbi:hypothetical protein AAJ76_2000050746 [Vairimorpha ceranae]|uniref:Uncharacterized protein n=1 Tax=Vairimorpha ceranae TaxID=40302 RepID=A0A0F9WRD8_9MICR|nr:hypothetical protein AAJ76_2000050746 [Vairimorpha ceranae]KKO75478.1 hypothetical protein AAJ76_2000050746 [Vairimorpha ceranae]